MNLQIGLPGRKYGLQKPTLSAFKSNEDSDEEKDVNRIIQEAAKKKTQKQTQQEQAKVLAEDPTAFDYDSVYDTIQQSRKVTTPTPQKDISKKPRYIHDLLATAAIRNKEEDIIRDRMAQKERETEGEMFAGKEKFLTSAYKKKLQENKLWLEEEKRKAALEEDVTKKNDLGSFYTNLLTHNEAYAGGRRPSPPPTSGQKQDKNSEKNDKKSERESRESKHEGSRERDRERSGERGGREKEKEREREREKNGERGRDENGERERHKSGSREEKDRNNKSDNKEMEINRDRSREKSLDKDREENRENLDKNIDKKSGEDKKSENGGGDPKQNEENNKKRLSSEEEGQEKSSEPATKVARKIDDAYINAARERYLKRRTGNV